MMGDIISVSFVPMVPELYLCLASILLLMYGAYCKRPATAFVWLGLLVLIFTGWLQVSGFKGEIQVMNGMFATGRFILFTKLLLVTAGALVMMLSIGWLAENRGRPFEFIILMLLALLGMMCMISANDLLTLYMGLEMQSLAIYVLASFNRDNPKSSEAGLKYFALGALASGMLLFGMSLVYGFSGTTNFDALGQLFTDTEGSVSRGILLGMVLIMVAFCFKLSAVPFHMWTPDVYEGAPTPVTAFLATAPKIAAFALFTRLLIGPFGELMDRWQQVIIAASVLSMLVGALAAIMQTNIKRLLAYSSIGHVGFMLMALATGNGVGVQAMLIYLGIYIFMNAGMFGCVLLMKRGGQSVEEIEDLSGLSQTHPAMAFAIAVFMFSMAGIPPLAGFFGKMYVVIAAIQAELVWLAVLGVVTSVIGAYYYIKVVKVMYFDEPVWGFDANIPILMRTGIAIGTLVTFFFFMMPTPLVAEAKIAADTLIETH
jgi:NADH-quinone oxidoreductase subunit N